MYSSQQSQRRPPAKARSGIGSGSNGGTRDRSDLCTGARLHGSEGHESHDPPPHTWPSEGEGSGLCRPGKDEAEGLHRWRSSVAGPEARLDLRTRRESGGLIVTIGMGDDGDVDAVAAAVAAAAEGRPRRPPHVRFLLSPGKRHGARTTHTSSLRVQINPFNLPPVI